MLDEIADDAAATAEYTGRAAFSPRVMAAMAKVPRHEFVPAREARYAYVNNALPIGHGQTISQPYIVALMTDLLDPQPDHVVLEVGTGSGYQAAVLSQVVRRVYSIEVIPELAEEARHRLVRLGCDNVTVRVGDGNAGWPEHAPFDGILVTAAAPVVPDELVAQLRSGGRMVMPIGQQQHQDLILIEKADGGAVRQRSLLPVAFVPLVGRDNRRSDQAAD